MSHKHEDDHDHDQDEVVSLSNLPFDEPNQTEAFRLNHFAVAQDQFEFGSSVELSSEMCNADEVFFQGQILPFKSISRSQSMDHVINSRSSSIKSQYSSSSGSSTGYKPKIRNQFHSHPSPSPKIRSRSVRVSNVNPTHKSTLWSFLQTGLVRPPPSIWGKSEINKSFGSRNSSNSTEKKKNINGGLFFGSCKCDSVVNNVVEIVVASEKVTGEKEGKQAVSRHRTFEWLKQLSLEDDESVRHA